MTSILIGKGEEDGPAPDFTIEGMEEIPPIVARLNGDPRRSK
jgi:hypothetical protein